MAKTEMPPPVAPLVEIENKMKIVYNLLITSHFFA